MNRTRPVLACVLALLALAAVSCSLPTDKSPRNIDPTRVPGVLQPATGAPVVESGPNSTKIRLYFVNDTKLVPIDRTIRLEPKPNVRSALEALLAGPTTAEKALGITSQIPPDTKILSIELKDGVLVVDLSKEINQVGGTTSKTAYAQLTLTLTSVPGINKVSFLTEGVQVAAPTDKGNVTVVRADDYATSLSGGS
jgi:spore germination protein GerM